MSESSVILSNTYDVYILEIFTGEGSGTINRAIIKDGIENRGSDNRKHTADCTTPRQDRGGPYEDYPLLLCLWYEDMSTAWALREHREL